MARFADYRRATPAVVEGERIFDMNCNVCKDTGKVVTSIADIKATVRFIKVSIPSGDVSKLWPQMKKKHKELGGYLPCQFCEKGKNYE